MPIIRKIAIAVGLVLAFLLLVIALVGINAMRKDATVELLSLEQARTAPALGETVELTALVRLPWHRRIVREAQVYVPNGLQLAFTDAPRLAAVGAGYMDWEVRLGLQAVEFGTHDGVQVRVPLLPRRDGTDAHIDLKVKPIEPVARFDQVDDPQQPIRAGVLSPAVSEEEAPARWPWVVVAVIALALLARFVLFRKRAAGVTPVTAPSLPAWELAQLGLVDLEGQLPMQPDLFFVRLVDILRRYLEVAFHLRATEQTTVEFLNTMQSTPDLLMSEHRALLEAVIRAADIVKFARTGASDEQMRDALKKATRFVLETSELLQGSSGDDEPEEPIDG